MVMRKQLNVLIQHIQHHQEWREKTWQNIRWDHGSIL